MVLRGRGLEQKIKCIVCNMEFEIGDKHLYEPLKHFSEYCFCRKCLETERTGL